MSIVNAIQYTFMGFFMMYEMNKMLKRSMLHDRIMTSNVDHNSIYVCTLRDIIVMLIHAISGIDNLVINSLTFNMIRNILMDIFMNNDRDHALMILVSLKRIVYK